MWSVAIQARFTDYQHVPNANFKLVAIVHSDENRDLAIARGLHVITVQLLIHEDEDERYTNERNENTNKNDSYQNSDTENPERKKAFHNDHFSPRVSFGCASGNLNVPPIVRSSLTREDTVNLPDSSHKSSSSSQFFFLAEDDARLFMTNSLPDFEWLVKPGVTILRSGFTLRLPCVNMLGSSGCMLCALPTDFLRLRVIRDIMATWRKEAVLVSGSYKKPGNLQLGW